MADERARRGVPQRLLLPPPPRDPELRRAYEVLPFDTRRRLAHVRPEEVGELPETERVLVHGLAAARLATSWRLLVAAPVLGWLVLMTLWGFGRSAYPDAASTWLLAGVALGAIAWLGAAIAAAARLQRARTVLARSSPPSPPTPRT